MPTKTLPASINISGVTSQVSASMEQALKTGAFTVAVAHDAVAKYGPEAAGKATSWVVQNPVLAACAAVGTTGLVIVAAPALASMPLLCAMGFGAGGVQAGSTAAAIHATLGNVVAGAPFAIAQSAGAGGAGLATVNGVAQVGGAALAAGGAGVAWIKSKL